MDIHKVKNTNIIFFLNSNQKQEMLRLLLVANIKTAEISVTNQILHSSQEALSMAQEIDQTHDESDSQQLAHQCSYLDR